MLELRQVSAFYGKSQVLRGVDLSIMRGEIVSILGRNGSGRSTLVKAVMGMVDRRGDIRFRGHSLTELPTYEIARLGVAYVPEQRDVFPGLTVAQNLQLGMRAGHNEGWTVADMYQRFPRLRERADTPAGVLSGGEQQMLTLCRSVLGNPQLIMVDEPTEGLAPAVVKEIAAFLMHLRERGVSVLLVEQKLAIALDISDRIYVIGQGAVQFEGTPKSLLAAAQVRTDWLEV